MSDIKSDFEKLLVARAYIKALKQENNELKKQGNDIVKPYKIEIGKLQSYIQELEHERKEFEKKEDKTRKLENKCTGLFLKINAIISDPITGLYKRKFDRLKKIHIQLRENHKIKPIVVIDGQDKIDNYILQLKRLLEAHKKLKEEHAELLEKTRDSDFLPKMTLEEKIIMRESKYKKSFEELTLKLNQAKYDNR